MPGPSTTSRAPMARALGRDREPHLQRAGIRLDPDAAATGADNKTQRQCPDPIGCAADGRTAPAEPASDTRAHRTPLWNAFDTPAHVSTGAPPGVAVRPPPGRGSATSFRWRLCRRRRQGSGAGGRGGSATEHFVPACSAPGQASRVAQVVGPVLVTQLVQRGELIAGERIPSEQGRGRRFGGDVTHTVQQGPVTRHAVVGITDGPRRLGPRDGDRPGCVLAQPCIADLDLHGLAGVVHPIVVDVDEGVVHPDFRYPPIARL